MHSIPSNYLDSLLRPRKKMHCESLDKKDLCERVAQLLLFIPYLFFSSIKDSSKVSNLGLISPIYSFVKNVILAVFMIITIPFNLLGIGVNYCSSTRYQKVANTYEQPLYISGSYGCFANPEESVDDASNESVVDTYQKFLHTFQKHKMAHGTTKDALYQQLRDIVALKSGDPEYLLFFAQQLYRMMELTSTPLPESLCQRVVRVLFGRDVKQILQQNNWRKRFIQEAMFCWMRVFYENISEREDMSALLRNYSIYPYSGKELADFAVLLFFFTQSRKDFLVVDPKSGVKILKTTAFVVKLILQDVLRHSNCRRSFVRYLDLSPNNNPVYGEVLQNWMHAKIIPQLEEQKQ